MERHLRIQGKGFRPWWSTLPPASLYAISLPLLSPKTLKKVKFLVKLRPCPLFSRGFRCRTADCVSDFGTKRPNTGPPRLRSRRSVVAVGVPHIIALRTRQIKPWWATGEKGPAPPNRPPTRVDGWPCGDGAGWRQPCSASNCSHTSQWPVPYHRVHSWAGGLFGSLFRLPYQSGSTTTATRPSLLPSPGKLSTARSSRSSCVCTLTSFVPF